MIENTIVPRHGHARFYTLLKEMEDLHNRKNANYSSDSDPLSNLKECEKFGIPAHVGVMVRITDKISRVQQLLLGKPDLVGESIKDTLFDMAVYSLLAIILIEEKENHGSEKR
jgi:Nucleotide modification associated domain 1